MELLARWGLIVMAACYSPDVRDCTLTCGGPTDCAQGQVCGADHFCASPAIAGQCASLPPIDAAPGTLPDARPVDARPVDAHPDARPDAPVDVQLHVHVDGPGSVTLDGGGSCSGDCMLPAPRGVPATLRAFPNPNKVFVMWTSVACAGQGAVCTFTPTAPTPVDAKFDKGGDN